MSLILGSAALVALERNERPMWIRLKTAEASGQIPVTHGGVLGQVWCGDRRQARLAQALRGVDIRPLDLRLGRAAGELLAAAGSSDVIDAALLLLSADGDDIVTSDHSDFEQLAAAADRHVELIRP